MSGRNVYDPAKQPGDPLLRPYGSPDPHCFQATPGGNNTLTNYDDKGVLETHLFGVIAGHRDNAELRADHGAHKQGAYRK